MRFNDKCPQLVDERGQPFCSRIQKALRDILPRLRRQFPAIRDEAVIANILEKAGRAIVRWESENGHAASLHGLTWVTVNRVAISTLRESSHRVEQSSIGSMEGQTLLSRVQTDRDGPEAIENKVLINQACDLLSPLEKKVIMRKRAGFTSDEIAAYLKSTPAAVDQSYFRAKHKIRKFLQSGGEGE